MCELRPCVDRRRDQARGAEALDVFPGASMNDGMNAHYRDAAFLGQRKHRDAAAGISASNRTDLAFRQATDTGDTFTAALISGLNGCSRPATVVGLVIAIVVDAIERDSYWTLSHIGEEVFESRPPFADRNTTVGIALLVPTTCVHTRPRHIRWSAEIAMLLESSGVTQDIGFLDQTATTPNSSGAHQCPGDDGRATAFALTLVSIDAVIFQPCRANDGQSSPFISGNHRLRLSHV